MITNNNYFDKKNRALTRSKIMDYLLCPDYFKRKHISFEFEEEELKDAFKVGSAVDDLIAQIDNVENYAVFEGDRRKKIGKEEYQDLVDSGKIVLSQKQYDSIINIANAVTKTTAYKQLKDFKKQEVLAIELKVGEHFDYVAGLPDFILNDKKEIIIVDLKTSRTVDERRYLYHSLDYGYFMQAGLYAFLAQQVYGNKPVKLYHLVVEKTEPYRVKMFRLFRDEIKEAQGVIADIIMKIQDDKDFNKADCSFETAIVLGRQSDWYDEEDED